MYLGLEYERATTIKVIVVKVMYPIFVRKCLWDNGLSRARTEKVKLEILMKSKSSLASTNLLSQKSVLCYSMSGRSSFRLPRMPSHLLILLLIFYNNNTTMR